MISKFLKNYKATLSYLLFIVLLNTLFSYVPNLNILGEPVSIADFVAGLIYVMRDFAQRETGHWVIAAMLAGCGLSWLLAEHQAAFASVAAFSVGETIDWGIFTFSGWTLPKRLFWSSIISAPVDTWVNLWCLHQLNSMAFIIMTTTKFFGIGCLVYVWMRNRKTF